MEKSNTGKKSEETKEAKENRTVQKTQITGSSISRLIVCCEGRKHIDHTHSQNMQNETYKLFFIILIKQLFHFLIFTLYLNL